MYFSLSFFNTNSRIYYRVSPNKSPNKERREQDRDKGRDRSPLGDKKKSAPSNDRLNKNKEKNDRLEIFTIFRAQSYVYYRYKDFYKTCFIATSRLQIQ